MNNKNLLYFIVAVIFFDIFVQLPVISPYAVSLGATVFFVGVLVAAYSISNMAGNFLAGPLIDRYGRKTPIVVGSLVAGIVVFLYSMAVNTATFFAFRIIHGLATALITPAAFAFLGDNTNSNERGKAMAKSGFAISIPALIGPPLGGSINAKFGAEYVFALVALLLVVVSLTSYILLKEPSKDFKKSNNKEIFLALIKDPLLQISYLAAFSLMFAKGVLMYMLPLHVEKFGYTSTETGILFGSFAFSAIIMFLLPINISDRIGRIKPLLIGLTLVASAVAALTLFTTFTIMLIIMFVYGIGFGFLFPAMTALLVDATTEENRGAAFGIFYGLFSAGVVLGPISTGYLVRFDISPFIVASIVVTAFTLFIKKQAQK